MIRAVEQFLQMPYDKRKEMGIKARQKMEREFDRCIVVEKYRKTLQKILG